MTASHLSTRRCTLCVRRIARQFSTPSKIYYPLFFSCWNRAFSPSSVLLHPEPRSCNFHCRERRETRPDEGSQRRECYICKMSVLEYNTSLLAAKSSLLMLVILQCNFFPSLDVRRGWIELFPWHFAFLSHTGDRYFFIAQQLPRRRRRETCSNDIGRNLHSVIAR